LRDMPPVIRSSRRWYCITSTTSKR
jgi:hypothetical protein